MELPIYHVDVFTDTLFAGNPAAVCLLPEWLPDETLQAIAAENYLPETSFVLAQEDNCDIRWFSPAQEMPLCGHGTMAAAYVLFQWVKPWLKEIVFSSASGKLRVERAENNLYRMDLPVRTSCACDTPEGLEAALGVMPRQFFISGDYHLALVESERQVKLLKPNLPYLASLGIHKLIITAPGDRADFVSRYFKTEGPIHEDPVTGSTHCILMPFWARRLSKTRLSAQQVSKRGGSMQCELKQDCVLLTGAVKAYLQGSIII